MNFSTFSSLSCIGFGELDFASIKSSSFCFLIRINSTTLILLPILSCNLEISILKTLSSSYAPKIIPDSLISIITPSPFLFRLHIIE
ncbi:hypothetical protein F3K33_11760 [Clostridium diolis]|nr:hypothetical protein X276_27500 [Clostridium beijerinckii NRRL B-598]QES73453.1 hypothetical protein F3K33_11760 [Clostridium diolis]